MSSLSAGIPISRLKLILQIQRDLFRDYNPRLYASNFEFYTHVSSSYHLVKLREKTALDLRISNVMWSCKRIRQGCSK